MLAYVNVAQWSTVKRGRPVNAQARRLRREEHQLAHPALIDGCRRCRMREIATSIDWSKRRRPEVYRPDQWDSTEHDRLAELCGRFTPSEIAHILNAEFHRGDEIVRTGNAVKIQIARRGLSRWMHGYRMYEVEQIFRFDHRGIHKRWLQPGLLVPTRTFNGRGDAEKNYCFSDEDLERFVRTYPWAYDYRLMADPNHLRPHLRAIAKRLRTVAELIWTSDPWLTRDEFLPLMGWRSKQPWGTWALERQLVPFKRRWHTLRTGARSDGEILIHAADVPGIREAISSAREQHYAVAAHGRRGKPAHNRGKPNPPKTITTLRCFVCAAPIVRAYVLPLHCPTCGELAWDPRDLPRLDIYEDSFGGLHVRRWAS